MKLAVGVSCVSVGLVRTAGISGQKLSERCVRSRFGFGLRRGCVCFFLLLPVLLPRTLLCPVLAAPGERRSQA